MFGSSRVGDIAATAAVTAVLALGLTSCSSTVPKSDVETSIETELGKTVPNIGEVTCPGDLDAEVGKTLTCEFVVDGQPTGAVATVTSIEGSTANYDIKTEARPIPKALLETSVGKLIGDQIGVTIDSTSCAGDLQPQVGQSVDCTLMAGTESRVFKAAVTSVELGQIGYSVNPA